MTALANFAVTLVLVMAGGAFGAALRWLTGEAVMRQLQGGFPWSTLMVNLVGSFFAGWLLIRLEGHPYATLIRPLIVVGLLGGLTTFSSLMVELVVFYRAQQWSVAVIYLLVSLVGGLMCVGLGARLASGSLTG